MVVGESMLTSAFRKLTLSDGGSGREGYRTRNLMLQARLFRVGPRETRAECARLIRSGDACLAASKTWHWFLTGLALRSMVD